MKSYVDLVGRLMLAQIFVVAGAQKAMDYAGTLEWLRTCTRPLASGGHRAGASGGLALAVGFQARLAALALAGFSIIAAPLFHAHFGDEMQALLFKKDIAIAGGLLTVWAHGVAELNLFGGRAR